ncbi:MAG TPA: HAD family hydrolase [Armatimonadota bacterium]|nr:HAD family hydrolase [Armatimonadota bacterium]
MEYKLVVTDLDGTLFDSNATIPEANVDALRAVIDYGVPVAIASGRRFGPFALKAAESIGRPIYLILCNGAVVVDKDFETVLLRQPLSLEDVQWLVHTGCAREMVHWNIHRDEIDLLWRREDGRPIVPDLPDEFWKVVTTPDDLLSLCTSDMLRVRIWASDKETADTAAMLKNRGFTVDLYPYPGEGDSYIEIMTPGVNKTTSIEFLANRLGFGLEQVVAFGDGTNDVHMLGSVGMGVAMANAIDTAKDAARMTTTSNIECGVAHGLAKLFPEALRDCSFIQTQK